MAIDPTKIDFGKLDALAATHYAEFTKRAADRQPYEADWLCLLRQSNGEYDPETIQKLNNSAHEKTGSRSYPQWTRSKEVPLYAKLIRFILSDKDRNFGLRPTPKPSVDSENLLQIVQSLVTQDEQGQPVFPDDEKIEKAILEFTKERASKMEAVVADQLTEDNYRDVQKKVIRSAIRYGLGITKGPEVYSYTENELVYQQIGKVSGVIEYLKGLALRTASSDKGQWVQKTVTKYRPTGKFLSIWNFYPDMNNVDLGACYDAYEYDSIFKHELRKLEQRSDFFKDVIEQVIADKPDGDYTVREWERLLVENEKTQEVKKSNKYGIIERNGYIDSKDLFDAGIIEEDDGKEYFCNEFIVGGKIIKLSIWPEKVVSSLTNLYHIFYYEKDETSILGRGLPKIIRNTQLALSALSRGAMNNAAWSVGPTGEINAELLHPTQRATAGDLHPLKFFVRTGVGQELNQKVLSLYDVPSRSAEFINLINALKEMGDQESSLPSYMFGTPSPNETLGAASTRYASLMDFIQNLVKNYDDSNVSYINSVVKWNQEFNPDNSIKGDMRVVAMGTAAQLIKETIAQQMTLYAQALPPEGKKVIDWRKYSKLAMKPMLDDPEEILLSEEVIKANEERESQEQAEITQLQKQLMVVKADYDLAKSENMKAKAALTMAQLPHKTDSVALDNVRKRAEVEEKTLDMAHSLKELMAKQPTEVTGAE